MKNQFIFSDKTRFPMTEIHVRRARELSSAYDRTKVKFGSITQKSGSIRNILSSLGVDNPDTRVLMYLFPLVRDGAIRGPQIEAKSYNMVNQYFSPEMAREIRYLTPQYIIPEISERELELFDKQHEDFKTDFQGYLENRIFKRFVELKSTDAARLVFICDILSYEGHYGSPTYKALKLHLMTQIKEYTAIRKESAEINLKEAMDFGSIYLADFDDGSDSQNQDLNTYKDILKVWSALDELIELKMKKTKPQLHEVHRTVTSSIYENNYHESNIQKIIDHLKK